MFLSNHNLCPEYCHRIHINNLYYYCPTIYMLKSLYISFMFIPYFSLKGNTHEKQISITEVSSK